MNGPVLLAAVLNVSNTNGTPGSTTVTNPDGSVTITTVTSSTFGIDLKPFIIAAIGGIVLLLVFGVFTLLRKSDSN
jgi:hypothetical protein